MAILAAPTTEPSVAQIRQISLVYSTLSPLIAHALQVQQILRLATLLVIVRTYFVARVLATAFLFASRVVAFRTYHASKFLMIRTALAARQALWALWDSKKFRRIRKKIEFEFFVLLLGPGGNSVLLLLFWPGWIVLIAAAWGLSSWAG
ncbi:hypothetical protein B0T22DRAFT_159987 [Podospora appendiculata]|uniref:Uncharacterized protein n=1 Tax=Podospora appendiculata TaxID=314037 RepID=A0AAE0X9N1_9PEZI|nr:hypothetical protein B0T22DRAFT_159987 [Podospora appendiculata]